ncbi:MAG: hypothetical protein COX81_03620 [Candidatus Magasanikbacteria bacterium CG_4_10_14_0_2_um_filter_37_12]|uniref:Epoxyqueuosine reductase QueH n=1 Tax=Candidatus Magasanikbacteria bacterium CG_4_10_14_0_2_um_filter_37_12 TaxID=1974637 RepID=A0A2M7V6X3_9BACT|nr:MAG: hypothetical protein COX81_03620 [Candidatus Magasanikbacteria bacterium CG_4_10_14_0_2_um_filter_37_12]
MAMKKLLLHTCCAPCSIVIIDELKSQYDLTVFFFNPNIHPVEEYLKRKKEVIRVCKEWDVKIIDMEKISSSSPSRGELIDYGQEEWSEAIKGFEDEPEGGLRCPKCFYLRLHKSVEYSKENNFDIFSTTLTSGRNKKIEIIGGICERLGEKYGIKFLAEDWKKGGRQEKGKKMVEERGIYRQDYCGCVYSRNN